MLNQLISCLAVLGIVVTGLLLIVGIITLEQAWKSIARLGAGVIALLLGLCILRGLFVGTVMPWLASLLPLFSWIAGMALVTVLAILLAKIVLKRSSRKGANRESDNY